MRDVLIALSVLFALGVLAWLLDLARRALLRLVQIRQLERDAEFHRGFLEGLEIGSGTGDNMRRIEMRKRRFGR